MASPVVNYSSNLDILLSQNDDDLKLQYKSTKDILSKPTYHRLYDNEISVELIDKPYTREMKTALVKRWLLINSKQRKEPAFNLHNYLSHTEVVSCLFHLMEIGDKNADNLYELINDIIKNSEELLKWLHDDFKNSDKRISRRQRLRFKYFYCLL